MWVRFPPPALQILRYFQFRDASGFGITVSYWRSEEDIRHWRRNAEHTIARERGRTDWYEHYELRVAKVERAYGGPRPEPEGA